MEFTTLVKKHESIVSRNFNNDTRYKELTSEVIDQRNFAMEKLKIFLDYHNITTQSDK